MNISEHRILNTVTVWKWYLNLLMARNFSFLKNQFVKFGHIVTKKKKEVKFGHKQIVY